MSRELKKGEKGSAMAEKVVVAVKAAREIPKTALVWALTHVVQPGDCITLLVVISSHSSGRKLWGFPRFAGDCASGHRRSNSGTNAELNSDITDYCSQMILQLHDVYDPNKINVKIKLISGTPCGAVAAEAKKNHANWVVLDKHLKNEEKRCMEELQCNIVVMKRSQPKVLRLNLVGAARKEPETVSSDDNKSSEKQEIRKDCLNPTRGPLVTPSSSPETFTATEAGTSSVSSSDPGTSPFFIADAKECLKKEKLLVTNLERREIDESSSDSESETLSSTSSLRFQPWMADIVSSRCQSMDHLGESARMQNPATRALLGKLCKHDDEAGFRSPSYLSNLDFSGSLREAISFSRSAPLGPPPLCSICQHKTPVFGKPPRWFTYAELEHATGGFSQANFLAEGGYGSVHRGVLPDGQTIAVKQHKLASSQGDQEFCSEVEVLSCAQHRNVVMLIGFCIEDGRRLLVYEYICNGSLDSHLYGRHQKTLPWNARQKVAVGAARGLRYLHEECRVGCIVHRDMRPNNILLTHDFEPLVGDFGLARWQPDGETGVETRTQGPTVPHGMGKTHFAFHTKSYGKCFEADPDKLQARPLLEAYAVDELVDPRLGSYAEGEVYCMLHAASLCIRRDPQERPRMSQVLRILEGDGMDSGQLMTPGSEVGSRSGRMANDLSGRFSSNLALN
ncbi:hypothetical protein SASPL_141864 [Salvia splendens]|uniref:Protein kinase domain-containing protein n=1 Tax=Salvia splendens TaxID=180675 RepID=A0A8X8WJ77_SALSN|nr:hypothetical protein SASPL_141864 [Salvia splendens]